MRNSVPKWRTSSQDTKRQNDPDLDKKSEKMMLRARSLFAVLTFVAITVQCAEPEPMTEPSDPNPIRTETATLGAGCYWCVEAVLQQVDGVVSLESGFMGGDVADPSYEQVCTGTTGHAEVVQVKFDPEVLSYEALLEWFWQLHDPTTLNRQGADEGPMYRSAIFYHSDAQRVAAEASKRNAGDSGKFYGPIVTEITEAGPFYVAKQDHQDFYRRNREYGYCRAVIAPKLDKLGLKK